MNRFGLYVDTTNKAQMVMRKGIVWNKVDSVTNHIKTFRLLTSACLETWLTKPTMSHTVERFQSSGQLQKPFTTRNTPLPVTSGVMGVCSMRFGVLVQSRLKEFRIWRYGFTK